MNSLCIVLDVLSLFVCMPDKGPEQTETSQVDEIFVDTLVKSVPEIRESALP